MAQIPPQTMIAPLMTTAPNSTHRGLPLSTFPSQPIYYHTNPYTLPLQNRPQIPVYSAASYLQSAVAAPAIMPQVGGAIYHPQGFPPPTIPQQLPCFVPGGQLLFPQTAVTSASGAAAELDPNAEMIRKEFMETIISAITKSLANRSSLSRPSTPNTRVSAPQIKSESSSSALNACPSEPHPTPPALTATPQVLVYSRKFILQLKTENLEPLANILTEVCRPSIKDRPDMFNPHFSGGSGRKDVYSLPKTKVINVKEEVQLNKAVNHWVRPSERRKEMTDEEKETAKVISKFNGILNKLTPQNFQSLSDQALELKINSNERLRGCINKIFEKALGEPKFSIQYAKLCQVMSQITVVVVKVEDGKEMQDHTTFRYELLRKCQHEFEKDKKDDEEREKILTTIDKASTDEEEEDLKAKLEALRTKARRRSLGNMRFIGELFNLEMLSEQIVHECIIRLLSSESDEDSIEYLCMLITTTGKKLDREQAKDRLDQYFDRIVQIKENKNTSSRIRYMLLDVLDLRKRNWVPRHQKDPTTIDEIRYKARLEEEKEKEMVRNLPRAPPKGRRCRDMADKGRPLRPQGESDNETKDSRPDRSRNQGICKRDRTKEPAGGFRPQRWGKPQGSSM